MKKIPHQAYALALQLLRQTDMVTPKTAHGALSLVKGGKYDRTTYQIISSILGRASSDIKSIGLAAT